MPRKSEVSKAAALLVSKRKHHNGGRPRSEIRCDCGKYTIHTAALRRHRCGKGE
jgi:hypothetical protein